MLPQRHRSPLAAAAIVVAAGLPGVACLVMGGVHPQSHLLLCAGSLLSCALLVAARLRTQRPLRLSWLGAPFLIGLLASLLSLLPLPSWLRTAIDNEGADRVAGVAALLSADAARLVRPVIAYDPPEAALAILRLIAAIGCFVVVAHGTARVDARRLAYRTLTISALFVLAVALGHALADVEQVWGRFGGAGTVFHAPLVNPNHLGKVFAFFALLCLGRGLSMPRVPEAVLTVVVGLACMVGVWLTDSRGSLAALGGGIVVLVVLLLARRNGGPSRAVARALGCAAALGVVWAAAVSTLGADGMADLAALDPEGAVKSKLRILPYALEVARAHALIGTGSGAFGLVLPSHLTIGALDESRYIYTHVENVVLQTFVDRGLVVGSALIGTVTWIAWKLGRTRAATEAPGAAAGLAALLAGDLVDFLTELPAGILLGAVALGLLIARVPEGRSVTTWGPRTMVVLWVALVAIAGLTAPIAASDWPRAIDRELTGLRGNARRMAVERALARHPSDGQYAYELAVQARHRRDPRTALLLVNRALTLWPAHRGAHIEAARALAALGRTEQALVAYRTAWRCGHPDQALLAEVLERFPNYPQRRSAFPDDPDALEHLCRALREPATSDDAQACYDELAGFRLANPHQRAGALYQALERTDVDGAVARFERTSRAEPVPSESAVAIAHALVRRDGAEVALKRTEEWAARLTAPTQLLAWRTRTALSIGNNDVVDASLASLVVEARQPTEHVLARRVQAEVLEKRGQASEAHRIVSQLAGAATGDIELWIWRGHLELNLGRHAQAAETARRMERAWPDDPRVRAFVALTRLP